VQHLPGAAPLRPVEQLLVADAGVVDQDVDRPGQLLHLGYEAFYPSWVGQVGRHRYHVQLRMGREQAGAQLLQPPGAPRDQDQGRCRVANRIASSRPMPEEAPVISTVPPSTRGCAVSMSKTFGME
jgi:hypothetical protein